MKAKRSLVSVRTALDVEELIDDYWEISTYFLSEGDLDDMGGHGAVVDVFEADNLFYAVGWNYQLFLP